MIEQTSPTHHGLRKIGGLGVMSSVLIGLVAGLGVVSTWTFWKGIGVAERYVAGVGGVSEADLARAEEADTLATRLYVVAFVLASVIFVIWLWRARANAEALCPAPHRRARGWTIGAWICPVVNLWFPYQVVDDVHRASRPGNVPDLRDLRAVPRSALLGWWWAMMLATMFVGRVEAFKVRNAQSVDDLRTAANLDTIASAFLVVAAVLIIVIVQRINGWQRVRRETAT